MVFVGLAREVKSIFGTQEQGIQCNNHPMFSNQSRSIFGGPPAPPQNIEVPPRKTKLFEDFDSPWSQSPDSIKNLFPTEDQINNSFKFPKNIDTILLLSKNAK